MNYATLERQSLFGEHPFVNDDRAKVGPGVDGYLLEVYSESQDDTVYIGFYGPADLFPDKDEKGESWDIQRAISFAALAIVDHDNQTERWNAEDYLYQGIEGARFLAGKGDGSITHWPTDRRLESLASAARSEWRTIQMEIDLEEAPDSKRSGPPSRM